MNKRLEGCQRLRRGEGAVTGAMDENLAQQAGVAAWVNHSRICLLVLVDHQSIASGVHGKYRNIQLAVEGDELVQVIFSLCIRRNARSCIQGLQVLSQIQTSLLVEGSDFISIG